MRQRLWSYDDEAKKMVVREGVQTLPAGAFRNSRVVREIDLPEGFATLPRDCFRQCPSLTRVQLPSVQELGAHAFSGCCALQDLHLPEGPETLPEGFLEGASGLQELTLPAGLRRLGRRCLKGAKALQTLHLPGALETLEREALDGCISLQALHLPAGLARIETLALPHGGDLAEVHVDEANPVYESRAGVLFSRGGETLVLYPAARQGGEYEVPEGVRKIGSGAFAGNRKLHRIVLPASLEKIGRGAFAGCSSLREVIFCSAPYLTGATAPAEGVFAGCRELHSFICPEDWCGIPPFAFADSGLVDITWPRELYRIGRGAFQGCEFARISVPASVHKIGAGAFYGSAEVQLPATWPKGYWALLAGLKADGQGPWHDHLLRIGQAQLWCGGAGEGGLWQTLLEEIRWDGKAFDFKAADQGFEGIEEEDQRLHWVLMRLAHPQNLSERAEKRYTTFLRKKGESYARKLISAKDEEALRTLLTYVQPDSLDGLMRFAQEQGATQLLPLLMAQGKVKKRQFAL